VEVSFRVRKSLFVYGGLFSYVQRSLLQVSFRIHRSLLIVQRSLVQVSFRIRRSLLIYVGLYAFSLVSFDIRGGLFSYTEVSFHMYSGLFYRSLFIFVGLF